MNEEMREYFERWAETEGLPSNRLSYASDIYSDALTRAAWDAWREVSKRQSEIICRKCGLREERGEKPECDF